MKEKYAEKQHNELFLTLPNEQILTDLGLYINNRLTFATVILLGKKEIIERKIPQARVFYEYRHHEEDLQAANKLVFTEPYFLLIEKLWNTIDLRNDEIKIEKDDFYPSIKFFNKKIVREAINNAIAHRNYRSSGEIFIKQYPTKLSFVNPGGFPLGFTLDNILNVSVSRNRLLSDVLSKTAEVERSGQGIDTIYFYSISEGKGIPDYTQSDDFQVVLNISGIVQDKAFAKFIGITQSNKEKPIKRVLMK